MATTTSMGSMRSQFLTRAWVVTPPYLHYQIPHQNIPRSADPYLLQTSHPVRPQLPPNTINKAKRPFFSQRRDYSTTSIPPTSKIPHISAHIAVSSSGKGHKFRPEKSTFDYDQRQSPPALGLENRESDASQKRRERPDSGQDAYFVAMIGSDPEQNATAFGVCDGVGGWAEHGIDPADFSHGLCSYMAQAALDWSVETARPTTKLAPRRLIEIGYDKVLNDPEITAGGTTACVGIIDDQGRMRIANLGDSGFLQLRLGTVHHYSNPQTHAFNTPFQLSLTPPEIMAQAQVFGGVPLNDLPERADLADHMLQHGDVLVLATDGVWDNLSSQDVLTTVSNLMRGIGAWERTKDRGFITTEKLPSLVDKESAMKAGLPGTLQSIIAATICGEAKSASLNRKRDGPFAKAVKMHAPYDPYHGGKVDDITVLVLIPIQNGLKHGDEGSLKAKL